MVMIVVPEWKSLTNKDLLITVEAGNFYINKECTPSIQINKNNPNASIHLSLKFDSIAEYKQFLKELENKIPLLQEEFNQSRREYLELNSEKKK